MSSIPSTSYVLDSRQKILGSTVNIAVYNLADLGSPVEAGTYEMLSFNTRNDVYNVDDTNDEIYFDEGGLELGPILIPHGYYTSPSDLADAIKIIMDIAGAGVYTITFNSLTNLFTFSMIGGSGVFAFNWGTNGLQPIANLLLGFTAIDGVDNSSQTSDRGIDLDPHSNLLVRIDEDSLKNVTLVNGTEYSLIIPLTASYASEQDGLKNLTFNQTIRFVSSMNQLTVRLFLEDGSVLPNLNAAQYTLIIRRVF